MLNILDYLIISISIVTPMVVFFLWFKQKLYKDLNIAFKDFQNGFFGVGGKQIKHLERDIITDQLESVSPLLSPFAPKIAKYIQKYAWLGNILQPLLSNSNPTPNTQQKTLNPQKPKQIPEMR